MAEYIEREKALEDFDKWIDETGAIPKGTSYYYECRACIEDVPSADVVEVVHGEWVHIKDCGGGKCSGHCSVCWALQEASHPSALKEGFRYCRWCGARMDGEKND